IQSAFAHDEDAIRRAKNLLRDLEKVLGERPTWTLETTRQLYDVIRPLAPKRKRTADHERMFWLLSGYCLRPGIGHPDAPKRVAFLFRLFTERLGNDDVRTYQQFWIGWRRIVAGLGEEDQLALRDTIDPLLAPAEKRMKKPKGLRLESPSELVEM